MSDSKWTPESFDPHQVARFEFEDNCAGCCGCRMVEVADGEMGWVESADYDRLLIISKALFAALEYLLKVREIKCLHHVRANNEECANCKARAALLQARPEGGKQ